MGFIKNICFEAFQNDDKSNKRGSTIEQRSVTNILAGEKNKPDVLIKKMLTIRQNMGLLLGTGVEKTVHM